MSLYVLSYDLKNRRNYQTLWDELSDFNAVRVLGSLWCFERTHTTAENLREYFRYFVDEDDALFVAEIARWATLNTQALPPGN